MFKEFLTGDQQTDNEVREMAIRGLEYRYAVYLANQDRESKKKYYSEHEVEILSAQMQKNYEWYKKMTTLELPYWFKSMTADRIDAFEKKIATRRARDKYIANGTAVGSDKITAARMYPIPDLVEVRRGFVNCLWHNEKTPSMKYYEKNNTLYCFGCQKSADSIDVYMKLNEVDFRTAVDNLCKI